MNSIVSFIRKNGRMLIGAAAAGLLLGLVILLSPIKGPHAETIILRQADAESNALNWGDEKRLDIFSCSDVNVSDEAVAEEIVVEASEKNISQNSLHNNPRIIAPGTKGSFSFYIKNNEEFQILYRTCITPGNSNNFKMPVYVKVEDGEGKSLSGDDWIKISEMGQIIESGELKKGEEEKYTVIWKWDFEKDSKEDTMLGNEAVNDEIACWMKINVEASGNSEIVVPTSNNDTDKGAKTGDSFQIGIVVLIMVISAAAVLVVKKIKGRKKGDK